MSVEDKIVDIREHYEAEKRAKSKLHSLLISKLPEKRYTPDTVTGFYQLDMGYNSAIDDMKAVLAEMFEVKG